VAIILAYVLTEGDHRKMLMEVYIKCRKTTLGHTTGLLVVGD